MDITTYALAKKQAVKEVPGLVDDWLEENVDPSTGYVLDNTLTLDNAAPPASAVGDLKSAFSDSNEVVPLSLNGYLSSANGAFTASDTAGRNSSDFISTEYLKGIGYSVYSKGNSIGYICFYNDDKSLNSVVTFSENNQWKHGIVPIPSTASYFRACKWTADDGQFYKPWIDFEAIENKTNRKLYTIYDLSDFLEKSETGNIGSSGADGTNSDYARSQFLPVSSGEKYEYALQARTAEPQIAFYTLKDASTYQSANSVIGNADVKSGTWTVPADGFIRIVCKKNKLNVGYFRLADGIQDRVTKAEGDISTLYEEQNKPKYLYGDSLNKLFAFSGKTALAFGDSIINGVANEGSGNYDVGSNSFIKKFASEVGLSLTLKAKSGSTITYIDDETIQSVYTVLTNTTSEADVIIIAGGTNDYNTGRTIGTFGDSTKYTLYGALKLICEHLQTYYSNATIIFITPINITKEFNGYPITQLNLVRNAIFEVATYYGYNVVDGRDMIPVTKTTGYDITMITAEDGCHPTLKGHAMYARNLSMKLC